MPFPWHDAFGKQTVYIVLHASRVNTVLSIDQCCVDRVCSCVLILTLKVLVTTIYAQWEGMGDVGSARYEPALLPPCPAKRVLSYNN